MGVKISLEEITAERREIARKLELKGKKPKDAIHLVQSH